MDYHLCCMLRSTHWNSVCIPSVLLHLHCIFPSLNRFLTTDLFPVRSSEAPYPVPEHENISALQYHHSDVDVPSARYRVPHTTWRAFHNNFPLLWQESGDHIIQYLHFFLFQKVPLDFLNYLPLSGIHLRIHVSMEEVLPQHFSLKCLVHR